MRNFQDTFETCKRSLIIYQCFLNLHDCSFKIHSAWRAIKKAKHINVNHPSHKLFILGNSFWAWHRLHVTIFVLYAIRQRHSTFRSQCYLWRQESQEFFFISPDLWLYFEAYVKNLDPDLQKKRALCQNPPFSLKIRFWQIWSYWFQIWQ